ncbi:hypothetical protein P5W99_11020 [Paraburkholderia sp. A3BS-1L]|uniref:hypothetical protein n=1 Tax=Paraburkholderia sp. A3BS-1L TaxID=3028375 RepID=UPI003DA89B00
MGKLYDSGGQVKGAISGQKASQSAGWAYTPGKRTLESAQIRLDACEGMGVKMRNLIAIMLFVVACAPLHAQETDCQTDMAGLTRCSNGMSATTDDSGLTRFNNGMTAATDTSAGLTLSRFGISAARLIISS